MLYTTWNTKFADEKHFFQLHCIIAIFHIMHNLYNMRFNNTHNTVFVKWVDSIPYTWILGSGTRRCWLFSAFQREDWARTSGGHFPVAPGRHLTCCHSWLSWKHYNNNILCCFIKKHVSFSPNSRSILSTIDFFSHSFHIYKNVFSSFILSALLTVLLFFLSFFLD